MSSNTNEFRRIEIKYVFPEEKCADLMARIQEFLKRDDYSHSTIRNLYYDTEDYRLIRASIDKPLFKQKLRIRSYGAPGENIPVFIELKKKMDGVVFKNRILLPLQEALRHLDDGEPFTGSSRTEREIQWFAASLPLKPKAFLAYERESWKGVSLPELRITFDRNITYRENGLSFADGLDGLPILDPANVLMEIKALGAMPLWLSRALADTAIYPCGFSKYGKGYGLYTARKTFCVKGGGLLA